MVTCCEPSQAITKRIGSLDIILYMGDYYSGFFVRLLDAALAKIDLTSATVLDASIYEGAMLITKIEAAVVSPATMGLIRVWAQASQTALLTKTIPFPELNEQCDAAEYSPYRHQVILTREEKGAELTGMEAATNRFTFGQNHFLVQGQQFRIRNSTQTSINDQVFTVNNVIDILVVEVQENLTVTVVSGLGGNLYVEGPTTIVTGKVISARRD